MYSWYFFLVDSGEFVVAVHVGIFLNLRVIISDLMLLYTLLSTASYSSGTLYFDP